MAETYRTNLPNVAAAYINTLGIKVTETSLKNSLKEHPFFPSLYALSNVFERFNIGHTAFKIDKENIDKLSTPFIAYLDKQTTGKDFVTVTSVTPDTATYIAGNKKIKTVSKEDFLKSWLGIVLQAQPDAHSGEKDFSVKRKTEVIKAQKSNALIAASALILFTAIYFFLNSLPSTSVLSASVLLLIKLTGLAATVLLLIYEIDKSNAFVKNICSAGKQTNCEAVLGSNAAKVFGTSWGEVGFFYFAATFLFLLFPGLEYATKISVLAMANLVAAPYILFSVYYQWKVVKQWCPLCLTVQAVLLSGLIWSIVNVWTGNFVLPTTGVFLPALFCLGIPMVLWFALKPVVAAAKEAPTYKAAYKRLLYNPETFHQLLQQQPTAPDGYHDLGITIGNPNAEHTIIKVCNPYCGPCAKAHPVLDEIIHNNKNVKLKLIFTASNDEGDIRGTAARHLLAVSKKHPELTESALDDWYLAEKKDYKIFSEKYRLNGEIKEQEDEIEKMSEWCKQAEIAYTPTIFVNGHRLPEKYSLEELRYIL